VTPDATIAQEEVFGPVLSVLRYSDDDEAVRIANNSQYGLSGAVWGSDVDRALAVVRRVRTGHRGQRIRSRRCAVRRLQTERVRPGERRDHRDSSVHGAEGHRTACMKFKHEKEIH